MEHDESYRKSLTSLAGRAIAVVYVFEGEASPGYQHYDTWKSNVISGWMNAIQELRCVPFLVDLRTFIQKVMNSTLPPIDFILNLNTGNSNLSTLGLVPSTCAFLSLPCIPCSTIPIITGENKLLSNMIAQSIGINVPKNMDFSEPGGISRPLNFGSSIGVRRGWHQELGKPCIYQEFIRGYDITTPILYNPITRSLEVLPSIKYCPETPDPDWYHGETEKGKGTGYVKKIVNLDAEMEELYLKLATSMQITTYCRIDARVSASNIKDAAGQESIAKKDLYFCEINPMPTIKEGINFHNAIECSAGRAIGECFRQYQSVYGSYTGFILSCAMLRNIHSHV